MTFFSFLFSIREKGGGWARRKAGRTGKTGNAIFFNYRVDEITSVPSEHPVQMKGPQGGSCVYQTAREAAAHRGPRGKTIHFRAKEIRTEEHFPIVTTRGEQRMNIGKRIFHSSILNQRRLVCLFFGSPAGTLHAKPVIWENASPNSNKWLKLLSNLSLKDPVYLL